MDKIIEDFRKVLSSNKVSFDTNSDPPRDDFTKQKENFKEKTKKSKSPFKTEESNTIITQEKAKIIVPEIKYPVSIKSLSSNQNFDPMYKEIVKNKDMETSQPESKISNNSSQNLSQKVNSLINENKERKKFQTQKFISKN